MFALAGISVRRRRAWLLSVGTLAALVLGRAAFFAFAATGGSFTARAEIIIPAGAAEIDSFRNEAKRLAGDSSVEFSRDEEGRIAGVIRCSGLTAATATDRANAIADGIASSRRNAAAKASEAARQAAIDSTNKTDLACAAAMRAREEANLQIAARIESLADAVTVSPEPVLQQPRQSADSAVAGDSEREQLVARLSRLEQVRERLLQTATSAHPEVQAIEIEIADINRSMRALTDPPRMTETIESPIQDEFPATTHDGTEIRGQIGELIQTQQAARLAESQADLAFATAMEDERRAWQRHSTMGELGAIQVVSAVSAGRVKALHGLNAAAGMAGGAVLLGGAFAFVAGNRSAKIRTIEEATHWLSIPVIGAMIDGSTRATAPRRDWPAALTVAAERACLAAILGGAVAFVLGIL